MTTSAAERLETDSYSMLMHRKTGRFKEIKVSLAKISIDDEGIRSTLSIYQVTLAPSARFSKQQLIYKPEEPLNQQEDKVHE